MKVSNPEEAKKLSTEQLLARKRELEYLVSKYNNIQLTRKVQLNSCYGAFGNKHFRFYDVRIAGSVTIAGQFVTRTIDTEINKYFNKILGTENQDYVVFCHTDSMYIRLDGVVKKLFPGEENPDPEKVVHALEKACKTKIVPKLNQIFKSLASYVNAFENKMNMKIEVIADRGVWTGKNRYALNIYYKEGKFYRHPQLKTVGIETVKSSIPMACRSRLAKALEIVLRKDASTLRKLISEFEEEYWKLPLDEIAFPTSVKNLNKFVSDEQGKLYVKGTPKHVKGALLYNHFIEKHGLEKDYNTIKEGDKVKVVTLQKPNPIHDAVISYVDTLPSDWCIEDYIDRKDMFQKGFLNPVMKVTKAVGWNLKEQASVFSVFGWKQ